MRLFFDWFREQEFDAEQPWLVFGKGPSFGKRHHFDLAPFKTVALNHAVREQQVTLAHVIDANVLEDCGNAIEQNAEALVMPWVPHVNNFPGPETLLQLRARVPLLQRLSRQDRLLWYNVGSTAQRRGDSPVVPVKWFSAEAVLNLLALNGVRQIRSLGIDGGAAYANEFDDIKDKTLLANGHESFDRQFAEIAKTIARTGIDYAPLDVESPIRVYVGALEEQMLAVKVLEYSIRKHASMTTEVFPLHRAGIEVPTPRDPQNAPRTPFSFQRFLIPQLAGYRGRAIYLDSDMQLFHDISGLWTMPFAGADLLAVTKPGDDPRRSQFSVMLLDCDSLSWSIRAIVVRLDSGELTYERLMHEMAVARNIRADINPVWNSLERYEAGRTALVHYTDMPTQPWVSRDNPLGHLWVRDLIEAIDAGYVTIDYVRNHVALGWVRPSLVYQVEHRVAESLLLPRQARALDADFVAPYKLMNGGTAIAAETRRFVPWLKAKRLVRSTLSAFRQRPDVRRLEQTIRYRSKSLLGQ